MAYNFNDPRTERLLLDALGIYGAEFQLEQTIEECAELIVALRHLRRGKTSDVVTELADVAIMIQQMRLLFGAQAFDMEVEKKLTRLQERLKTE